MVYPAGNAYNPAFAGNYNAGYFNGRLASGQALPFDTTALDQTNQFLGQFGSMAQDNGINNTLAFTNDVVNRARGTAMFGMGLGQGQYASYAQGLFDSNLAQAGIGGGLTYGALKLATRGTMGAAVQGATTRAIASTGASLAAKAGGKGALSAIARVASKFGPVGLTIAGGALLAAWFF